MVNPGKLWTLFSDDYSWAFFSDAVKIEYAPGQGRFAVAGDYTLDTIHIDGATRAPSINLYKRDFVLEKQIPR